MFDQRERVDVEQETVAECGSKLGRSRSKDSKPCDVQNLDETGVFHSSMWLGVKVDVGEGLVRQSFFVDARCKLLSCILY